MPLATSQTKQRHNLQFEAIGTQWLIASSRPLDDVKDAITKRIEEFDQTYSRFRDDSLVNQIAEKAGTYDFPADAVKMVGFYKELYDATNGAVSPLVGNALADAGYDKDYSLVAGDVRKIPSWDEAMTWNGAIVVTKQPVTLDFGAAGKGYLVDEISELMERDGHDNYTIDASGDIKARGDERQTIGLENPFDAERVIGTMDIQNASLCASATNRRAWGEWHHVIDGRNARPTRDVVATWVVASDTLMADGLATALFFASDEDLHQWSFAYVRMFADGRIEHSPDFVGQLFT